MYVRCSVDAALVLECLQQFWFKVSLVHLPGSKVDLVVNKTSHTLKLGTMHDAALETDPFVEVAVAKGHTREVTAVKSDLLFKLSIIYYFYYNMMFVGTSLVSVILALEFILDIV